jgi:hypothetical protein
LKGPTRLRHEPLEDVQVELAGVDAQQVPRRAGDEPLRAESSGVRRGERLPQVGDVALQGVDGCAGRFPGPQLLDELVAGEDLVGAEQEERQ